MLCFVVLSNSVAANDDGSDIEESERTEFAPARCIPNPVSLSCIGESLCEDTREGDSNQFGRRLKTARYGKRYRFSGHSAPTDSRLPRVGSGSSSSKQKSKSKSME